MSVRNTGDRAGAEVVQLFLHDPVAQVTRPPVRLIGYAKVRLQPGEVRRVTFGVHADLSAFTGRRGLAVVEPGELELRLSGSSTHVRHAVGIRLVGEERVVDHRRRLTAEVALA
jgi:beta-xylosidase